MSLKTSLGIWAFGSMVTRFVPAGYQPEHAGETTAERVARAVGGLGDLMDGYEFHYPNELSDDNLDEVRAALGDHDIYCIARVSTSTRASGAAASPHPIRRCASRHSGSPSTRPTSRAGSEPTSSSGRDRGLQLPLPDALRR